MPVPACHSHYNSVGRHRTVLFDGATDDRSSSFQAVCLPNFVTSNDNRSVALNSSISITFFSLFPGTVRLPTAGVKNGEQTVGQGEEDRLVRHGAVLPIPRVPHIWNMTPCS
jgi:hypothetical protein